MRTAAFVSGGHVPMALRGTTSPLVVTIADWYATFASLAGANAADDPPVPPAAPDPARPLADLYGNEV